MKQYCEHCGTELNAYTPNCPICGAKINWEQPETPSQQNTGTPYSPYQDAGEQNAQQQSNSAPYSPYQDAGAQNAQQQSNSTPYSPYQDAGVQNAQQQSDSASHSSYDAGASGSPDQNAGASNQQFWNNTASGTPNQNVGASNRQFWSNAGAPGAPDQNTGAPNQQFWSNAASGSPYQNAQQQNTGGQNASYQGYGAPKPPSGQSPHPNFNAADAKKKINEMLPKDAKKRKMIIGGAAAAAAVIVIGIAIALAGSGTKTYDLADYVEVTVAEGYDGAGYVEVELNDDQLQLDMQETIEKHLDDEENTTISQQWGTYAAAVVAEGIAEDISWDVESKDGETENGSFSNGDTAVVTFEVDNDTYERFGVKLEADDMTVKINDLKESETVDVFDGLTAESLNLSGTAPAARVDSEVTLQLPTGNTVTCSCEPSSGLSAGSEITVTLTSELPEGLVAEKESTTVTVGEDELDSYLTDADELTSEDWTKLSNFALAKLKESDTFSDGWWTSTTIYNQSIAQTGSSDSWSAGDSSISISDFAISTSDIYFLADTDGIGNQDTVNVALVPFSCTVAYTSDDAAGSWNNVFHGVMEIDNLIHTKEGNFTYNQDSTYKAGSLRTSALYVDTEDVYNSVSDTYDEYFNTLDWWKLSVSDSGSLSTGLLKEAPVDSIPN